jgi:hypothetical protein
MIPSAKSYLYLTVALVTLPNLSFALTRYPAAINKAKQHIKICPLPLTQIGQTTSFRFQYIVKFSTDKDGNAGNIQKIRWAGDEKILNSENIIPCLKAWVLKPLKKYSVQITAVFARMSRRDNSFAQCF